MPRPQTKSGAALRYERQRREATAALAAQAAQVRALRDGEHPSAAEGVVEAASTSLDERPAEGRRVSPSAAGSKPLTERAESAQVDERVDDAPKVAHPPGRWPITALREGQCRFACTPHTARSDQHLFCGEPVAWKGNKPTSWCREHLPIVSGQPGRNPGGASLADATTDDRDAQPARSGLGSTGA